MNEAAARKQAKREAAFRRHLASFLVVNAFLFALNLFTSPGHLWAVYPLLGWGIGLANHAFQTYGWGQGDWVERRTHELMGAEASEERLRELLDETLDERAIPAGAPQDVARLQRRIEHLEAIVTSSDWDTIRTDAPLAGALDDLADEEVLPDEQAQRIARRVR